MPNFIPPFIWQNNLTFHWKSLSFPLLQVWCKWRSLCSFSASQRQGVGLMVVSQSQLSWTFVVGTEMHHPDPLPRKYLLVSYGGWCQQTDASCQLLQGLPPTAGSLHALGYALPRATHILKKVELQRHGYFCLAREMVMGSTCSKIPSGFGRFCCIADQFFSV